MFVNRIGDAEVPLGILEVDRIHFMRHRARTHLAGLDPLLEILHRNIHPHIAAEVDQHGVDAFEVIENRRQVVVMLDLGRILRTLQPQAVVHKFIGKSHPIHRRISYVMRVEIARRTAELGRHGQRAQLRQLLLKPLDEDQHLLTQTGGRRRLAVRTGQHRHVVPFAGHLPKPVKHLGRCGEVNLRERILNSQRNGGVVDVLRSEAEMHELLVGRKAERIHLLLQNIFDRLDVVVGRGFDLLDTQCIRLREIEVERPQRFEFRLFDPGQFRQRQLAQGDEIFDLDPNAVANQGILRKIIGQFLRLISVATVHGRNGSKFVQQHNIPMQI